MRNIHTIRKYTEVFSSNYSEFYQNDMISQIKSRLNSDRGGIAGADSAKSMLCGQSIAKTSFVFGSISFSSAASISASLSISTRYSLSFSSFDNYEH